jgi:excinuclease UvrABC nuclease subunit
MEQSAKDLDFMEAARYRDEFLAIEKLLDEKK